MGKGSKKPRKNKQDPRQFDESTGGQKKKKEKDWGFDDILRSKRRKY